MSLRDFILKNVLVSTKASGNCSEEASGFDVSPESFPFLDYFRLLFKTQPFYTFATFVTLLCQYNDYWHNINTAHILPTTMR